MLNKFSREIYRQGYIEIRSKYKNEWAADHPWNEMVMRVKARDRKQCLEAKKWEKSQTH